MHVRPNNNLTSCRLLAANVHRSDSDFCLFFVVHRMSFHNGRTHTDSTSYRTLDSSPLGLNPKRRTPETVSRLASASRFQALFAILPFLEPHKFGNNRPPVQPAWGAVRAGDCSQLYALLFYAARCKHSGFALHVRNALRRNQVLSDPHLCPKPPEKSACPPRAHLIPLPGLQSASWS